MGEYKTQTETTVFRPRRIAVLGASGSIGRQALEVIAGSEGRLSAELLSVHSNVFEGVSSANRFKPRTLVITDEQADRSALSDLDPTIEVLFGGDSLSETVRRSSIDIVLSAIVGSAGLSSVRSSLESGKTVALANKESLVTAGALMTDLVHRFGGRLIPVDSEHSAIYQCLYGRNPDSLGMPYERKSYSSVIFPERNLETTVTKESFDSKISEKRPCRKNAACVNSDEIVRLILTASGGPFRQYTLEQLKTVSVAEALCHPTWQMGRKITIDSATLMNKAFELVEAHWLFGVPAEKLTVVFHPQSFVHSMIEFIDGAVIAQLSPPDMRLPIQLALTSPTRFSGPARRFDWTEPMSFQFEPVDLDRFPAIGIGLDMLRDGGTTGTVVNAANETAVAAFLQGKISFDRIVNACRAILDNHFYEACPDWDRLFELDRWARAETAKWISF